jgi:hypothetical protein
MYAHCLRVGTEDEASPTESSEAGSVGGASCLGTHFVTLPGTIPLFAARSSIKCPTPRSIVDHGELRSVPANGRADP